MDENAHTPIQDRIPSRSSNRPHPMPAAEFSRVWASLPHLPPEEAALYEADIRTARESYPAGKDR